MTTEGAPTENGSLALATTLTAARETLSTIRYPLALPAASDAECSARAVVAQLDNYVLPRLARIDAPLLAVTAGSSGAGKSTLVNSLVASPISPSGVLRPTTRTPVLACHPDDLPWFGGPGLLPGLTRTSEVATSPEALRVVPIERLAPGIGILDSPDIDSVVSANRTLTARLLGAADLLLFVTTAARYADAVPWDLLRGAQNRGAAIAIVLDRVPPAADTEIVDHLTLLVAECGLGGVPIFILPESDLDDSGLLPESVVAGLRKWFEAIAGSPTTRKAIALRAVGGATDAIETTVTALASAADEQVAGALGLGSAVRGASRAARSRIELAIADGAVLQGEVLARWRELAKSPDVVSPLMTGVERLGNRLATTLTRQSSPIARFRDAVQAAGIALIHGGVVEAAEQCQAAWRAHPAGRALLDHAEPTPAPAGVERVSHLLREWQRAVIEMICAATEAGGTSVTGPDSEILGLLAAALVFTATASGETAGDTTTGIARQVLEKVLDPAAVETLVDQARSELVSRVSVLLTAESSKYQDIVDAALVDETMGDRLRNAANEIMIARLSAGFPAARSAPIPLNIELDGMVGDSEISGEEASRS